MPEYDDSDLILRAKQGDAAAENILIGRYKSFAEVLTRPYFIAGADRDDLVQIGLIGILKAVRTYDDTKDGGFKTYAASCIRNAVLDGVRESNAKKNKALNSGYSATPVDADDVVDALDYLPSTELNPEELFIEKETEEAFFKTLVNTLGDDDTEIIKLYLASVPYKEISSRLGITAKKVDNTIYNAKKKIEKILDKKKLK